MNYIVEKDILGFEISVDNFILVKIVDSLANLFDYYFGYILLDRLVLLQKIIELA
jgi:hypothetical protein